MPATAAKSVKTYDHARRGFTVRRGAFKRPPVTLSRVDSWQKAKQLGPSNTGPAIFGFDPENLTPYTGTYPIPPGVHIGMDFVTPGDETTTCSSDVTLIGCRIKGPDVWGDGDGYFARSLFDHSSTPGSNIELYGCELDGGGSMGTLDPNWAGPQPGVEPPPYTPSGTAARSTFKVGYTYKLWRCNVHGFLDFFVFIGDGPFEVTESWMHDAAFVQLAVDVSHNDHTQSGGDGMRDVRYNGNHGDFFRPQYDESFLRALNTAGMHQFGAYLYEPTVVGPVEFKYNYVDGANHCLGVSDQYNVDGGRKQPDTWTLCDFDYNGYGPHMQTTKMALQAAAKDGSFMEPVGNVWAFDGVQIGRDKDADPATRPVRTLGEPLELDYTR